MAGVVSGSEMPWQHGGKYTEGNMLYVKERLTRRDGKTVAPWEKKRCCGLLMAMLLGITVPALIKRYLDFVGDVKWKEAKCVFKRITANKRGRERLRKRKCKKRLHYISWKDVVQGAKEYTLLMTLAVLMESRH
jgi:hypothetical protein